jgi:hypothetical protein
MCAAHQDNVPLRLAPAFLLGTSFRMVTGTDLAVYHRGQSWSTNEPYEAPLQPLLEEILLDRGNDLAVAVAVAADLAPDVEHFIREQNLPAKRLLILRPPGGTNDHAVPDTATANALATGMRNAVRQACGDTDKIHLFMASPLGLAPMLGHRWNRLRATTVYEDLNRNPVYEAAFTIHA